MKPIAVFRHSLTEGPGHIATYMKGIGRDIRVIAIDCGDDVPHDPAEFAGLCFMGGPMSVNDPLPSLRRLPFLHGLDDARLAGVAASMVQLVLEPGRAVAEGDGVRPDVLVPETRADFVAGRDPVLAAAVQALSTGGAAAKVQP